MPPPRAIVVVVGDIGRSTRTQYHALALAATGVTVDLIGYVETRLPIVIAANGRIRVHELRASAPADAHARWGLATTARGCRLVFALTRLLLWHLDKPEVILVQNPHGVPILAVAWLAARARGTRLVIDWHNLTASMLAIRLGQHHPLVRAVSWHERTMGRLADANLFVSDAMKEKLERDWHIKGRVFHDHPAATFSPATPEERLRMRHLDYGPCITEFIRDGENGRLFSTSAQLASHLSAVAQARSTYAAELDRLRRGGDAARATRWREAWQREALPEFLPQWLDHP